MKSHRLILSVAILTLLFVARIYAEGTYQRTDDRKKTLVWNNDPQRGDVANWKGERDAEGYATGSGTLSWSRMSQGFSTGSNTTTTKKRTPISSYTGTMVHGKFEGVVTTVDHGKTYHAKFADGQRKGNWAAGAAVAKAEKAEPEAPAEKPERVAATKSTTPASEPAKTEKIAEEKKPAPPVQTTEQTTEDIPAAGPAEENTATSAQSSGAPQEASAQKSEASSSTTETSKPATPLIAQASIPAEESATPRQQPVTRKGALAPGAVRAIEKPGTTSAAPKKTRETLKKSSTAKTSEATAEKPKTTKPAPSQPTEAATQSNVDIPAAGPPMPATEKSPIEKPAMEKLEPPVLKSEQYSPAPPSAKETPVDDSIKSLTGPPSSLRGKAATPLPETNPPTQLPGASNTAPSPSVAAAPKLTPVQAMDIADIEARTRGYDLGEYQLPKAEYNSANDTWSVAYIGRSADGTSKKLSVVVQDKSGKAEVKK